jgi:Flp pilus assembly protein TadG
MITLIKSAGSMLLVWASHFVRRLSRDQRGNIGIITAISLAALVAFGGLGVDASLWMRAKQDAQGAADAAASSAAAAAAAGNPSSRILADANAATAANGFQNGQNGVTVTINNPPASGAYVGNSNAYEVIVSAPQKVYLASVLPSVTAPIVKGRAVALVDTFGSGALCVLSLDATTNPLKPPLLASGSAVLKATNCDIDADSPASTSIKTSGGGSITGLEINTVGGYSGNVHATNSINTGAHAIPDPYADRQSIPSSGASSTQAWTGTIHNPTGVMVWNGNVTVSGATTLDPGVYIINNGSFTSSQPITGTGVTIALTGTTNGVFTINSGATLNLSAPTTGTTAGIVFWADTMPSSGVLLDAFNGGSNNTIKGAVYSPYHQVNYTGSSVSGTGCTQLIGRYLNFSGSATFSHGCSGAGTLDPVSGWQLVE